MRRWLAAVVVAVGLATGGAQAAQPLRIAVEGNFPPFNDIVNGRPQGFDVDIANALCARMQAQCSFVVQPWPGMLGGLRDHRFDAIVSSMEITAERQRVVDFSIPYERIPASFAVHRGTRLTVSAAGLAGKTIAVERFCGNWEAGTEKYLRQKFGSGFRIKTYDAISYCDGQARSGDYQATLPRRLADLEAGTVDAVFDSKLILYPAVAGGSGSGSLEFAGPDQFGVEAPAGIAVRKGEPALLAALNAAIAAIMADGTYRSIERKYFPFPVYGE